MTVPVIHAGTNFLCAGRNMKRYTKEEIEQLSKNPIVRSVNEKRLVLTFEFRVELFKEWEKKPGMRVIQKMLTDHGINVKSLGSEYIKSLNKTFKRHGMPINGCNETSYNRKNTDEEIETLLKSGKFKKSRKGIIFTEEYKKELLEKYPEQSIEESIRQSGIDPHIVGYQRIYQLKKWIMEEKGDQSETKSAGERHVYTEKEVEEIELHPYVTSVSPKKLQFHNRLFSEAAIFLRNGYTLEEILSLYEIPIERLTRSQQKNIWHRMEKAEAGNSEDEMMSSDWTPERREKFIRIQRNRVKALEHVTSRGFEVIREKFQFLNCVQKKYICEIFRDNMTVLRIGSIRETLKLAGISKSVYYKFLNDDTVEERLAARDAKEKADMETIRKVADYGGYPKGSRAIYMQMPILENKRMSRRKIMRLMDKMGIKCTVRKANMNRRDAAKRLVSHVKPNILKRTFKLHRPGKAILTDVTYMKYCHGKKLAYASASIDAVTGRLYEVKVSEYNDVDLVVNTILALPKPDKDAVEKTLLHSDQGIQYLSDEYQELLAELGFIQSMSKRGNCWDNAPQESFFGHFKDEFDYKSLTTIEEIVQELERYKYYYNEVRGQWNRGKMTPMQREAWINSLSDADFEKWQEQELKRYNEMKQKAREKAIERNKTLGV